jgi:PucR C-terminal helix-turn-helix domain/GGDEF-like domain
MRSRHPTLPITLAELIRIEPLARAHVAHLADPARRVEQVVLAENFDRLRRSTPHSLIVLHAEAATGGWALATALNLAWERNASAVLVSRAVAGPSSEALAQRLNISLLGIDGDPVDVALQLAGQISAPDAARALRQAQCAERLAEQTGVRGVLGVLNSELGASVPVALVAGEVVVAGRASAAAERPDIEQVRVEVHGPGERPWARLVAAVPAQAPGAAQQVHALLLLARPPLLAAWAQTLLNSGSHAAHEQAAFGLLRQLAAAPGRPSAAEGADVEAPAWNSELGWQVEGINRAVWLAPLRPAGEPPPELTHLVRAAWQRGHPNWPLISEGDGWISWQSSADTEDVIPLRRALTAFRGAAAAHGLVVGVGRPHPGVSGLMRSIAEARLVAHVAREGGPGTVRWFDQVGAPAALAWLPVAELAEVAELCLAGLMGARDRDALVDTVLAVLDCGGSLSQASQRLGVHRNTVLARVARSRQLGLAFDDPAQRLALHVLCYALASVRTDPPGDVTPPPDQAPLVLVGADPVALERGLGGDVPVQHVGADVGRRPLHRVAVAAAAPGHAPHDVALLQVHAVDLEHAPLVGPAGIDDHLGPDRVLAAEQAPGRLARSLEPQRDRQVGLRLIFPDHPVAAAPAA